MSPICQRGQPLWKPRNGLTESRTLRLLRNLNSSAYELRSVTHHQGELVTELDSQAYRAHRPSRKRGPGEDASQPLQSGRISRRDNRACGGCRTPYIQCRDYPQNLRQAGSVPQLGYDLRQRRYAENHRQRQARRVDCRQHKVGARHIRRRQCCRSRTAHGRAHSASSHRRRSDSDRREKEESEGGDSKEALPHKSRQPSEAVRRRHNGARKDEPLSGHLCRGYGEIRSGAWYPWFRGAPHRAARILPRLHGEEERS